uniref:Uncharacterized protein n=1 Tax=Arundo donax TaxID=35708 RepID=A0A0A9B432_ARUDO
MLGGQLNVLNIAPKVDELPELNLGGDSA